MDQNFLTENKVQVQGAANDVPLLRDYSSDSRLSSEMRNALANASFTAATPIQAVAIPQLLTRKDLIGISKTGSGKTLAFLIPCIQDIILNRDEAVTSAVEPKMVVLTPTRELATQITKVCSSLGLVSCVTLYGGELRGIQRDLLAQKKPDIVVATPGRLIDFMDDCVLSLKKVKYFVFDEADRMFDMGFYPDMQTIMLGTNSDRQTLLFSATWDRKIETLARNYLKKDNVMLSIGNLNDRENKDIGHSVLMCENYFKKRMLENIFRTFPDRKILVFCATQARTEDVCAAMSLKGFANTDSYFHGKLGQGTRFRLIEEFTNGKINSLFATDAASRGLDVSDIDIVVNFDFPNTFNDFIHRTGRCGRNGRRGLAFTLVQWSPERAPLHVVRPIVDLLKKTNNEVDPELQNYLDHLKGLPKINAV